MLPGVILQANEILTSVSRFRRRYIQGQAVLPGQHLAVPVPLNLNRLTALYH